MPSANNLSYLHQHHDRLPVLSVPSTKIVAVEHPMFVKNLDNALKTFGRGHPFKQMMDPACAQDILPLYLRPNDPACGVLESHVTTTSNVVLKITVPKRTGRKRKRGSQGPFLESANSEESIRLDANTVFRSLNDNACNYQVEPLGVVNTTHRFRGLVDFHKTSANSPFMVRVREQILSGDVDKFKAFKLNPARGFKLNEDVIPPPFFSETNLPYPWAYQKGFETHEGTTKGIQSRIKGIFSHDLSLPIPTAPKKEPEQKMKKLVERLRECFEVRPIWTKRALDNYLGDNSLRGDAKLALHYVSYQFHGGPWRDANIKFGLDPRTDPECRKYQTVVFKIQRVNDPNVLRHNWVMLNFDDDAIETCKWKSHLFDGKGFCMDGRIWQVCDITDPLISKVLATEEIRETPDLKQDGWFQNGTYAKARAIMRTKIRALQTGQSLTDEDFEEALNVPDNIELSEDVKGISVPVPNVAVTEEVGNKEWNKAKKKKNARDAITFKMSSDHGAKRGKRLDVKGLQDAIAGDNMEFETDQSLRPSIETGGNIIYIGNETEMDDIMSDADGDTDNGEDDDGEDDEDDDGEDDDEDDDASLELHDDSSRGYGSDDR